MDTFCPPEISRRAFMVVVAGGLLAAPLGAEAQQPRGKSARIGLLGDVPSFLDEPFRQALRELATSKVRAS